MKILPWRMSAALLMLSMASFPSYALEDQPAWSSLEYSQTGGFAGIQSTIKIDAQGKLTILQGRANAAKEVALPEGKGQLSPEQLARLTAAVGAIDWKETKPVYKPQRNIADGFQYNLTISVGDKSHRVELHDPLDASIPTSLTKLIEQLNELKRKARE